MNEDELRRPEAGNRLADSWLYKTFIKTAERILHKPLAILDLAKKALAHLQRYASVRELAADAKDHAATILRMLQAYARNEYREVSKRNVLLSVAAIAYLVSPFDLIPDFLAAGLLDDITLILWVYRNFQNEMEAFRQWEDRDKLRIELPPHE